MIRPTALRLALSMAGAAVLVLSGCGGGDSGDGVATTEAPAAAVDTTISEPDQSAQGRIDPCTLADEEMITEVTGEEVTAISHLSSGGIYQGVSITAELCRYEYGEPIEDAGAIEAFQEVSVGLVVDQSGVADMAPWEELARAIDATDEGELVPEWPAEALELGDETAVTEDGLVVRDGALTLRFSYSQDAFSDDAPMQIGSEEIGDLADLAGEVVAAGDSDCEVIHQAAQEIYDNAVDVSMSAGGGMQITDGEQIEYEATTCRVELGGTSTEVEVTTSDDEQAFTALSTDISTTMGPRVVDDLGEGAYITGGHLFVLDAEFILKLGDTQFSDITEDQLIELAHLVIGD